jgi:threonine dehydrogenase-like Zn-dependent dehydrogenase
MLALRNIDGGVRPVQLPRPTGDGVRVRVIACGICGTDLANVRRGPSPVTPGHEIAGITDDGRLVAVEPMVTCGQCKQCGAGSYHLCQSPSQRWIGGSVDGGMAEEVLVPERALVSLPGSVDPMDACLVEPLAGALHGLRVARTSVGQRVALIGGGTMGLCALVGALPLATEVSMSAKHPHQAEAAHRLGATDVTGCYDLVVDAAGTERSLALACELVVPGGTICALAKYATPTIPISSTLMMHKELTLITPVAYCRSVAGRDIEAAAALLAARPDFPRVVITHRFPLERGTEAFAVAANRAAGSIKVVVHP